MMATLVILGVSAIDIYIASLPQMVYEFNVLPDTVNLTISAYTLGLQLECSLLANLAIVLGAER